VWSQWAWPRSRNSSDHTLAGPIDRNETVHFETRSDLRIVPISARGRFDPFRYSRDAVTRSTQNKKGRRRDAVLGGEVPTV
jgi:hypothetical protein